MWKNIVEPDRPQMSMWRVRIACWIPKATYTRSEYVILIVFPLQQRLHKHASVLRYTHIACLVFYFICICMLMLVLTISAAYVRRIKWEPLKFAFTIIPFSVFFFLSFFLCLFISIVAKQNVVGYTEFASLLCFRLAPMLVLLTMQYLYDMYEGWNFNSGNYLFTTDTK